MKNKKILEYAIALVLVLIIGICIGINIKISTGTSAKSPANENTQAVQNAQPAKQDNQTTGGEDIAKQEPVTKETESIERTESMEQTESKDETESKEETVTKEEVATKEETATKGETVTKEAGVEAEGEVYADVLVTNSWGDNPLYEQYSVVIYNKSSQAMDGWTISIAMGDGAELDNSWSANYSLNNGVLTITPSEHNSVISAGNNVECGFIAKNVTGDKSFSLSSGEMFAEGIAEQQPGGNSGNGNSGNNNGGNGGNSGNSGDRKTAANALEVPEPSTDDWLFTDGKDIMDSTGKKVWITGVNWFGYNTGTNLFDGLWAGDLNTSIQSIADHGFNLIRVPISAELILQWKAGKAPNANFNQATNYYLVGMDSLEIWDYVLGQFRACGLKVMIDIHSAETDASGHNINMWTTAKISTAQYQEALVWMAERYKNDDTIIAYDLKNEPHGKPNEGKAAAIWNDSTDANNWKYVAQETALMVLSVNPNVLIMVEGTEIYPMELKTNSDYHSTDSKDYYFNWWGGNLRGVKDYPIDLGKYQDKLVYSPHDYGPTVYKQPWFDKAYDFDSLMEDCWEDNWFYIYENNIAPLLIGEWGGYMREPNLTWMTCMRELIAKNHLNHTFWCFNANSGDTGGLVLDDFTTWDTEKYNFVKEVLWQQDGKFVGLDHQIPLGPGGNGITLSQAQSLK